MQKFKVFLISAAVIITIAAASVSAQSSEIIDNLIGQETAKFGETIYVIAVGSSLVDESASISDAMQAAADENWIRKGADANDTISLGRVCSVTMKALKIRGGLLYTLFPTPRYAVREIAYLELYSGEAHPGNELSGTDVLEILSGAIAFKEGK